MVVFLLLEAVQTSPRMSLITVLISPVMGASQVMKVRARRCRNLSLLARVGIMDFKVAKTSTWVQGESIRSLGRYPGTGELDFGSGELNSGDRAFSCNKPG